MIRKRIWPRGSKGRTTTAGRRTARAFANRFGRDDDRIEIGKTPIAPASPGRHEILIVADATGAAAETPGSPRRSADIRRPESGISMPEKHPDP
jgi:hypothetical protein